MILGKELSTFVEDALPGRVQVRWPLVRVLLRSTQMLDNRAIEECLLAIAHFFQVRLTVSSYR